MVRYFFIGTKSAEPRTAVTFAPSPAASSASRIAESWSSNSSECCRVHRESGKTRVMFFMLTPSQAARLARLTRRASHRLKSDDECRHTNPTHVRESVHVGEGGRPLVASSSWARDSSRSLINPPDALRRRLGLAAYSSRRCSLGDLCIRIRRARRSPLGGFGAGLAIPDILQPRPRPPRRRPINVAAIQPVAGPPISHFGDCGMCRGGSGLHGLFRRVRRSACRETPVPLAII